MHDETIESLVTGAGPIAVTARIYGVNRGVWSVTGQSVSSSTSARGARITRRTPVPPGAWSWRHWSFRAVDPAPVRTCMAPLAMVGHAPAVVPFLWAPLAALGIVVALLFAGVLGARAHLATGSLVGHALVALAVGLVTAKVWYIVDHRRRDRDRNGWCIQGLLAGMGVVLILGGRHGNLAIGVLLDTITPGLLFGMAIGRVGCFFTGCCAGRPTASRFGVWSSDRHLGMRRIPTQVLEASWTAAVGIAALLLTLSGLAAQRGGALFVGALAAYTLVRQYILRLRVEQRQSRVRGRFVVVVAAGLLVSAIVAHVVAW